MTGIISAYMLESTGDTTDRTREIEELLKEEEIPYLKKDRGTGSAMRIMMGQSFYGTDIYVPSALLEKALELITPADGADCGEEEDAPEDAQESEK